MLQVETEDNTEEPFLTCCLLPQEKWKLQRKEEGDLVAPLTPLLHNKFNGMKLTDAFDTPSNYSFEDNSDTERSLNCKWLGT